MKHTLSAQKIFEEHMFKLSAMPWRIFLYNFVHQIIYRKILAFGLTSKNILCSLIVKSFYNSYIQENNQVLNLDIKRLMPKTALFFK